MDQYCMQCMNRVGEDGVCPACGPLPTRIPEPHQLAPGIVLNGQYLLGNVLGQGGFGITYIARDTVFDMRVAVKEYYPIGYSNRNTAASNYVTSAMGEGGDFFEKGKQRFQDEARVLMRYRKEPGVVDVMSYFEANGTAYIVMEYLEGQTLLSALREGVLPVYWLFDAIAPIMNTLEKMHADSVIHRDVSPDNVMLLRDGTLRLMDFGAARAIDFDSPRSLSMMLKVGYTPEEQYRVDGEQGPWTDIYALCATLYKCITGITPDAALDRMHEDRMKWPSELGISIPYYFEAVLRKGMAPHAADRYQSISEMRRDIQLAKDGAGVTRAVNPAASAFAGSAPSTEGAFNGVDRPDMPDQAAYPLESGTPVMGGTQAVPVRPVNPQVNRASVGVQPAPQAHMAVPPAPKKPKTRIPLIAGVAACVIALAVGFAFLMNGSPQGSTEGAGAPKALRGDISLAALSDEALKDILSEQADADSDGIVTAKEAENVTALDCAGTAVENLDVIQRFTNLAELDVTDCDSLSVLSVNECPELARLYALGSDIAELDLSGNSRLEVLQVDDEVAVSGIEATKLREHWQITHYRQTDYESTVKDAEFDGDWSADFQYDRDGSLQEASFHLADNSVLTRNFMYDGDNRVSVMRESDATGQMTGEVRFAYSGSNISALRYDAGGALISGRYATVDDDGRVIHADSGSADFSVEYVYDSASGNLTEVNYHEPSGDHTNRFLYRNGLMVMEDDDVAAGDTLRDISYEYDDQDRCVKRTTTSPDGKEVLDEAVYSYDKDGRIQCEGVSIEYDEHGNVVKRSYQGSSGKTGTAEMEYRRVFLPEGQTAFQALDVNDPHAHAKAMLPCTINTLDGMDPVVAHHGSCALRVV